MEELGKQWHKDAKIHVTGDHAWSGTYNGYNDWVARMLSQIPEKLPGFNLDIQNVSAEADKVYLHVHVTAKNLDMHAVHMFTVKDGIQTEPRFFLVQETPNLVYPLVFAVQPYRLLSK